MYDLYKDVIIVAFDWGNTAKTSIKQHDWTYWGCISEAFNCLEYSTSNRSHGEGSPTVVHDPPGTKIISQPWAKMTWIQYNIWKYIPVPISWTLVACLVLTWVWIGNKGWLYRNKHSLIVNMRIKIMLILWGKNIYFKYQNS